MHTHGCNIFSNKYICIWTDPDKTKKKNPTVSFFFHCVFMNTLIPWLIISVFFGKKYLFYLFWRNCLLHSKIKCWLKCKHFSLAILFFFFFFFLTFSHQYSYRDTAGNRTDHFICVSWLGFYSCVVHIAWLITKRKEKIYIYIYIYLQTIWHTGKTLISWVTGWLNRKKKKKSTNKIHI